MYAAWPVQVLYTAHVGDSGAIIDRGGTAYRLTEDHKPYMKAERQRIQQAGGQLVENGNRVLSNAKDDGRASMLAMSRYHQLFVSIVESSGCISCRSCHLPKSVMCTTCHSPVIDIELRAGTDSG